MDIPKPKPPVNKAAPEQKHTEAQKKPFKLKAHLSHRPFSDDTLMNKLRAMAANNDQEGVTK